MARTVAAVTPQDTCMGRKHATLQCPVHSSAHNLDWAGAHIRYSDTPRSGSGALMESRPSASTRWQREVTTATAPSAQPAAVMHGGQCSA